MICHNPVTLPIAVIPEILPQSEHGSLIHSHMNLFCGKRHGCIPDHPAHKHFRVRRSCQKDILRVSVTGTLIPAKVCVKMRQCLNRRDQFHPEVSSICVQLLQFFSFVSSAESTEIRFFRNLIQIFHIQVKLTDTAGRAETDYLF